MLIEFSVANHLSFKDKVTFSMLASDSTQHESTNVVQLPNGERYLKTAVIYGANAAGKSNLMNAFGYLSSLVYTSSQKQPDEAIATTPFALGRSHQAEPTSFDVIFYTNNRKYAYGVVLDSTNIIEEYLYYFDDAGRQRTIFERTNITEYVFTDEYGDNPEIDVKVQDYFKKFTANNKLYLSIAVMLDYTPVKDAYQWLSDMYSTSMSVSAYHLLLDGHFGGKKTREHRESARSIIRTAVEWIKEIDTGIKEIEIESNPQLFKDDYFNDGKYDNERLNKMLNQITAIHETVDEKGNTHQSRFKFFTSESAGTHTFFLMALSMAERMTRGSIFIKDELNMTLHTKVSAHAIELFHQQNQDNLSQLIFTTHDTNLLNADLFRSDQIWFAEKDAATGATELFSLVDFELDNVGESIDIEKGYLLGVYGAVPFIKGDTYA